MFSSYLLYSLTDSWFGQRKDYEDLDHVIDLNPDKLHSSEKMLDFNDVPRKWQNIDSDK